MPSHIDYSKPIFAHPSTASVRNNFEIASDEITELQEKAEGAPFLSLDGGEMNGPLYLLRDPFSNMEAATKQYVDELAFGGGGGGEGGFSDAPKNGMHFARGGAPIPTANNDWSTVPLFEAIRIAPNLANAGNFRITGIGNDTRFESTSTRTVDFLFGAGPTSSVFTLDDDSIRVKRRMLSLIDEPPEYDNEFVTKKYLSEAVPPGTLIDFAGNTIPAGGWMRCDGRALSRTQYALLFAHIGTAWGAGDGETTFNIPDLRARATIGADTLDPGSAGDTGRNVIFGNWVGAVGGDQYLQSHNHGSYVHDPGHAHSDHGHSHGVGGTWHSHGFPDPGHAHAVTGHAHTINATHGQGYLSGGDRPILVAQAGTSAGTHAASEGIHVAGTNRSIDANYAGTNVDTAHANISWVGSNITQVDVHHAGGGQSQNMQPSAVVHKLIFTGVAGNV